MKVLTQAQLEEWLNRLAQAFDLVAPVEESGKVLFRRLGAGENVEPAHAIAWGFQRTELSPKEWTFPRTEPILLIEQGEDTQLQEPVAPPRTVLFGVRPCDARGALAIDALFLDREPRDNVYARHRERTVLIGLACPQMWESCFCTVVGGAPNSTEGLDILLTELGDGYAAQAISERGAELYGDMPGQERTVSLPEPTRSSGLPILQPSEVWVAHFEDEMWRRVGDRCLGCRVCTFVCPACRCFDVRDRVRSRRPGLEVFERLRAWDACTVAAYRRIAGGHDPRPTQFSRLRNRFYCKFSYYPEDFGPLGCVGCGRCIDACPVSIDILEVIAAVGDIAAKAQGSDTPQSNVHTVGGRVGAVHP